MLATAIGTKSREAVIEAAKEAANSEIGAMIEAGLAKVGEPNTVVAEYFGTSCHLPYGLRQNIHLIANCDNYVDAVRTNILAAGDNVGRSIMIGAICAALYGVGTEKGIPDAWIERVNRKQEVFDLLARI